MDTRLLHSHILAAVLFCSLLFPCTGRSEEQADARIYLCSDDSPESRGAFIEIAAKRLSIARFLSVSGCENPAVVQRRQKTVLGRFVSDAHGRVSLILELNSVPVEKKVRDIPWLSSSRLPLETTLQMDKVAALCIIMDNLVLEFEGIDFSAAPSLPAPPKQPAAPELQVEGELTVQRIWRQFHVMEASAGIKYIPPDVAAPLLGLGYTLILEQFEVLAQLSYEFDSTYRLEDRSFTTWALCGRIGGGYLFFQQRLDFAGVELSAQWRLNSYRRDDIDGARFHRWNDFGVGGYLYGRYGLTGAVGLLARVGIRYFPTSKIAEIPGGPEERVESTNISVTGGFDFIL